MLSVKKNATLNKASLSLSLILILCSLPAYFAPFEVDGIFPSVFRYTSPELERGTEVEQSDIFPADLHLKYSQNIINQSINQ